MKGITFGNLHSYRDLKLILGQKEIGAPLVKTKKLEIEGADGILDYTDFFGGPKCGSYFVGVGSGSNAMITEIWAEYN